MEIVEVVPLGREASADRQPSVRSVNGDVLGKAEAVPNVLQRLRALMDADDDAGDTARREGCERGPRITPTDRRAADGDDDGAPVDSIDSREPIGLTLNDQQSLGTWRPAAESSNSDV